MTHPTTVANVFALYERFGAEHYGEGVTQNAHALQCAALATRAGAADSLIAAALLHDIGHLVHLAEFGRDADADRVDDTHEAIGARVLSGLFGPEVTAPIALHVTAKRYRVATEPGYGATLSAASVRSLELQGGPLDPTAAATFAVHPGAEAAVQLRGWDDSGKIDGLDVGTFEDYRAVLDRTAR